MSSENVKNTNNNLYHNKLVKPSSSPRVDINHLMFKIRQDESKTKKENLLLFILIVSIVFSIGLALSF